ncbi:MAG: sugar ABC transporter permease [Acidimicrobiales bacterium]
MSQTISLPVPERAKSRAGRRRAGGHQRVGGRRRAGYAFIAVYVLLLLLFGFAPSVYAIYLSLTRAGGNWAGLANFFSTGRDFRFLPALEHIGSYLAIWLVTLVVLVLFLALMLHGGVRRTVPFFRFLFYLPGALAGAASVLVWLFMLDPGVSPYDFALSLLHYSSLGQTIAPGHLPAIFAVIAFWTGAGGWIVVMNGALNNISDEVIDSAKIDGANAWQLAIHVKLPLIKKWVVYMLILAFAAGTQLFVEPQLVGEASLGLVSNTWSPNQLAYYLATQNANFNAAAAISVDLLLVGLMAAAILVFRSKMFEIE